MVKAKVKHILIKTEGNPQHKIPYWEIDSGKEGPCLLVTAAFHGNEVQGSEAIRRFCPIAEKEIVKGRIYLVPFANPLALKNRRPNIMSSYEHPKGRLVETIINGKKELSPDPSDNINRTWPGDPNGSEAAQVTYVFVNDFWEKIKPTHLIDLHCYNRFTIACTLAEENNKESIEFAKAAAFPLLRTTPKIQGKKDATTITRWARESGSEVVSFAAEFSGQYILIEKEVKRGVRMLSNCSKHIGIFEGKLEGMDDKPMIVKDDKTEVHYVKAPISGLFIENGLTNGDSIEEGDILGYLFSDETLETLEIKAPVSGYLYLYGSCRHLCDVDLAAMHPYSDKDGILTTIIREKSI